MCPRFPFTPGMLVIFLMLWTSLVGIGTGRSATAESATGHNPTLAPEFPTDVQWLNSPHPLRLQELRGKVVLLDFWTYGCINCMHIVPDLRRLEAAYPEALVVIGVHSAKYDNEGVLAHIHQAMQRYGITHPVVNDRDFRIWNAYRVFGWPTQIVIDPQGVQLQGFVGEHHYERIYSLIAATIALHRQKGTLRLGTPPEPQSGSEVPQTPLRYPGKVLADVASGRLFIADTRHHRLVVADLQGRLLTIVGTGTAGATDGPLNAATFRQPQGMAWQGESLYVADTGNHLIRRVDLARQIVETVAGTGTQARELNVPGYGTAVPLNSPWALYGHDAALYIAMAGVHQIWRLDLRTAYAAPFAGTSTEALLDGLRSEAALGQPSGLSGHGQQLYIADSEVNAIRLASLVPNGSLTTLAGGGLFTFGDVDGSGSAVRLQHPLGVAYADGRLYIADTYNHKVKMLALDSGRVQSLAGTGQAGYHDGPAPGAQFNEPGGLSVGAGRLYVADTNNHRLRVIDLATRTVRTLPIQGLTPPGAPLSSFKGR